MASEGEVWAASPCTVGTYQNTGVDIGYLPQTAPALFPVLLVQRPVTVWITSLLHSQSCGLDGVFPPQSTEPEMNTRLLIPRPALCSTLCCLPEDSCFVCPLQHSLLMMWQLIVGLKLVSIMS